jgi:hypothetical protein
MGRDLRQVVACERIRHFGLRRVWKMGDGYRPLVVEAEKVRWV